MRVLVPSYLADHHHVTTGTVHPERHLVWADVVALLIADPGGAIVRAASRLKLNTAQLYQRGHSRFHSIVQYSRATWIEPTVIRLQTAASKGQRSSKLPMTVCREKA